MRIYFKLSYVRGFCEFQLSNQGANIKIPCRCSGEKPGSSKYEEKVSYSDYGVLKLKNRNSFIYLLM